MPLIQVSEAPFAASFNPALSACLERPGHVTNPLPDRQGPVCIVDDDDWVCDSLSQLLEVHGIPVRTYASGAEFIADQKRGPAGCLVIDQHMPGLDGLSVIAELDREGIRLPTILITGRTDAAIARRAEQAGVLALLEKPFQVAQLVALIRDAFTRRN